LFGPVPLLGGSRTTPIRQEVSAMCLAIPGKVVEVFQHEGLHMARVQFGGVTRDACLDYVPDTKVDDYVLVHVGFAISRVDEEEAQRTYAALAELDQLSELEIPVVEDGRGGVS
jgi:hydrogenase expression/formation protein HypC